MKTFNLVTSYTFAFDQRQQPHAGYVQNVQFRFVVTRLHSAGEAALTHRASTMRVAPVTATQVQAARGDYEVAGRAALAAVIESRGAARVAAALRAAEA